MSLRRRCHQMWTLHPVALSDVMDLVDLGVVAVQSPNTVLQQRAVVPGPLPQLVGHIDVLVGPAVALVMFLQIVVPEVTGGVGQRAG